MKRIYLIDFFKNRTYFYTLEDHYMEYIRCDLKESEKILDEYNLSYLKKCIGHRIKINFYEEE